MEDGMEDFWYGKFCLLWNMEDLRSISFHSMPWLRLLQTWLTLVADGKHVKEDLQWVATSMSKHFAEKFAEALAVTCCFVSP